MSKTLHTSVAIIAFLFSFSSILFAQDKAQDVLDHYTAYTEAPREVAYVHLNKSTYIKGEMLGFTAYVFDKHTKTPSLKTTNLYCTISDDQGNILKQKLLKLENGVASNIFKIDSTFTTGVYTFKAFTSWMRNFKENNHFEQTLKIIDPSNTEVIEPVKGEDLAIDLQVLGEGGHLLYDVPNTLGIIAKDQFGKGIAKATGRILDNDGTVISKFKLNDVGIAKTIFIPKVNKTYSAVLTVNDRIITTDISNIELLGLVMSLAEKDDKITLQIQTNKQTKDQINGKTLKLSRHNGRDMQITEFTLNSEGLALLSYPSESLFPGINIFTLFNDENKPLLERLYFNTKGLKSQKITSTKAKIENDSLALKLSLGSIDPSKFSNLSVSVLPTDTKSYNHHYTILSKLYLQPYIKGVLENSRYYFQNINKQSQYNLDLLMMTQGWSSYDWYNIFNHNKSFRYPFENGIDVVANVNGNKSGTYIVYPINERSTEVYDLKDQENRFLIERRFPTEDDSFRIAYIDKKNSDFRQNLYMQYFPSKFPSFEQTYAVPLERFDSKLTILSEVQLGNSWGSDNLLDEVLIKGTRKQTKVEEIAQKANGSVQIITDPIKRSGMRLDSYLASGFRFGGFVSRNALEDGARPNRFMFRSNSSGGSFTNNSIDGGPLVYLNDSPIPVDRSILSSIFMGDVDLIETGLLVPPRRIRGRFSYTYARVYTDLTPKQGSFENSLVSYDIPLKFEKEQRFYTPKYQYYNTDFYKEYGTIDWKPKLNVDSNGDISFTTTDTGTRSISLFVEGVVNESTYISEEIVIERAN